MCSARQVTMSERRRAQRWRRMRAGEERRLQARVAQVMSPRHH